MVVDRVSVYIGVYTPVFELPKFQKRMSVGLIPESPWLDPARSSSRVHDGKHQRSARISRVDRERGRCRIQSTPHPPIGCDTTMPPPHYFDYNATTPVRPEVQDILYRLLKHHGNPSSAHGFGAFPKQVVETARTQVASAIGGDAAGVYFKSCGTESDQWALWSPLCAWKKAHGESAHVVASSIEHPAIIKNLEFLESIGFCSYTLVPVDTYGSLDVAALDASITDDTAVVTIMHSNNEIGTIQDFEAINGVIRAHKGRRPADKPLLLHSDLAQSIGRARVDVKELELDFASIVGHKFGAPKGIAALYVAEGQRHALVPLIHGGGQEGGKRSGTENVPYIGALGEAIMLATENLDREVSWMRDMRDRFYETLKEDLTNDDCGLRWELNGHLVSLPNTLSISFAGVDAARVIARVGDRLAISSGSACHAGSAGVGSGGGGGGGGGGVLGALGKENFDEFARGTFRWALIPDPHPDRRAAAPRRSHSLTRATFDALRSFARISTGWETTSGDAVEAAHVLSEAIREDFRSSRQER